MFEVGAIKIAGILTIFLLSDSCVISLGFMVMPIDLAVSEFVLQNDLLIDCFPFLGKLISCRSGNIWDGKVVELKTLRSLKLSNNGLC